MIDCRKITIFGIILTLVAGSIFFYYSKYISQQELGFYNPLFVDKVLNITPLTFPDQTCLITDHDAVAGKKEKNTEALTRAITAIEVSDSDVVTFDDLNAPFYTITDTRDMLITQNIRPEVITDDISSVIKNCNG